MPILAVSFSVLLVAASSCEDDEDDPKPQYSISGTATGGQEVPPVETPGNGTVSGNYNSVTNELRYNISWTNVKAAPSMMHFHGPALPGENAPPIVNIMNFTAATTGTASGTATLTDAQETDLLNGRWYYNLHTPNHPAGEIRAQVSAQ